jgi:hypothetical protein
MTTAAADPSKPVDTTFCDTNKADGLSTSSSPTDVIPNTPISEVDPNLHKMTH